MDNNENEQQEYSSKTIFILDCSQEYSSVDSGQKHDIGGSRFRSTLSSTIISKSLYTCSVEAIFEYSRIVWDLFPNREKLLFFIATSPKSIYQLNNECEQNCEYIFNSFIEFTKNSFDGKISSKQNKLKYLLDGFRQALQRLTSLSPSSTSSKCQSKINAGRIIFLTFDNEDQNFFKNFQKEISKQFLDFQRKTTNRFGLDVIVINTYPLEMENLLIHKDDIRDGNLTDLLKFSFYSVASSTILAARLTCMAFEHFNLASTTVCNIPMKEEQNSGSSANYDVEIIHSRQAHSQFFNYQIIDCDNNENEDNSLSSKYQYVERDKQKYQTLRLKWGTSPKTFEYSNCIGAYRLTAIDVSSRPSSCLITFLLSGKTVYLEMPPNRSVTHMLRCHNGELFIHVLAANNNNNNHKPLIEDAPSISEGVGGRITDYRLNDFAELMKKNHLQLKFANEVNNNVDEDNLEQAYQILRKQTKYWPISIGLTVFFAIRDQFYSLITKQELCEKDLIQLRDIMYRHLHDEKTNVALPIQSNIIRCKGLKKEDLYRIYWSELEQIIRSNQLSIQHKTILQCFLDIKPLNNDNNGMIMFPSQDDNNPLIPENNQSIKMNGSNNNMVKSIDYSKIKQSEENLLNIFSTKLEMKRKKSLDFFGRSMKMVKLYSGLNIDDK
ncbi:hypothetical protein DERP_012857 [Dermatophagoides pteronyssinus]|uniref:Protein asunder n=1 Tax=Dermatophagoides pteronyssinus TaxID=6956 RepID=A0ABQ8J1K4_DERPT|nr:hypothetical protein DERP_012857 [Dermatophagoides pteronyssinus]